MQYASRASPHACYTPIAAVTCAVHANLFKPFKPPPIIVGPAGDRVAHTRGTHRAHTGCTQDTQGVHKGRTGGYKGHNEAHFSLLTGVCR